MANETVLLTGASGFLGSHIAQELLSQGYTVKATFRSDKKSQLFRDAFPGHKVETCIVKDITSPDAFGEAIKGVDHVIHSASPFTFHVDDIQRDLIDPAVNGTKAMLDAVASSEIKRLVITSSFAAVVSPLQGSRPGYTYTEKDWNPISTTDTLKNNVFGYQGSKTFAARSAWDFVEQRTAPLLVTICPPMIFGPIHPASGITLKNLNESSKQIINAVQATQPQETRMPVFVDVRDVAKVHVAAIQSSKIGQHERFVVCGGKFTWKSVQEIYQTGHASVESLEPSSAFYDIGCGKVEAMMGVRWTDLEASINDFIGSLDIRAAM